MIAVLGEDGSDCDFIACMLGRISGKANLKVAKKAFAGCSNLLREGAQQVRAFRNFGVTKFVVCVDADGIAPDARQADVSARVLSAGGLTSAELKHSCAVVPVEMIEAWILADVSALRQTMFKGWTLQDYPNPESIAKPKKMLIAASRQHNGRPKYDPSTHNGTAAKYVDIAKLTSRCPSFARFASFVRNHV